MTAETETPVTLRSLQMISLLREQEDLLKMRRKLARHQRQTTAELRAVRAKIARLQHRERRATTTAPEGT